MKMARAEDIYLVDIDGITVGDLREMLADKPASARVSIVEERDYGYGGWLKTSTQHIRITWEE